VGSYTENSHGTHGGSTSNCTSCGSSSGVGGYNNSSSGSSGSSNGYGGYSSNTNSSSGIWGSSGRRLTEIKTPRFFRNKN
jgi:hypothetical protein